MKLCRCIMTKFPKHCSSLYLSLEFTALLCQARDGLATRDEKDLYGNQFMIFIGHEVINLQILRLTMRIYPSARSQYFTLFTFPYGAVGVLPIFTAFLSTLICSTNSLNANPNVKIVRSPRNLRHNMLRHLLPDIPYFSRALLYKVVLCFPLQLNFKYSTKFCV